MLHRIALTFVLAGLAFTLRSPPAHTADAPELLAQARVNNRTESIVFRLDPRQARVSEIRIRSGSLTVHIEAVEILFADGGHARAILGETLPPGYQSRPIPVDSRPAISRVLVSKRPGLRSGETTLQLLGVPAR